MGTIAADSLYDVSYRSTWGADAGGLLGHLVVRRLDDHEVVAEIPVRTEDEARELIARAEADVRGPADVFERTYRISGELAADPGPDVVRRPPPHTPEREAQRDRGERLTVADARLTVFPDPRDVFVGDQQQLSEHLHPLVSIDLGAVDRSWHGPVHLLSPVDDLSEPADGSDQDSAANWLLFRVEDDGRYRLRGNRDLLDDGPARAAASPVHADAHAQLAGSRARWERYGALVWGDTDDPTRRRDGWGTDIAVVDQLGGDPGHGNWTAFAPPAPLALDTAGAVPVLRLDDGRPFTFVAATAGYPWRPDGADAILLFFEPHTRTAALTFDWG